MLWHMVPKEGFNSAREIILALQMAMLFFNEGRLNVNTNHLALLGLKHSRSVMKSFEMVDKARIQCDIRRSSEAAKLGRSRRHSQKRKIGFRAYTTSNNSGQFHSGSNSSKKLRFPQHVPNQNAVGVASLEKVIPNQCAVFLIHTS